MIVGELQNNFKKKQSFLQLNLSLIIYHIYILKNKKMVDFANFDDQPIQLSDPKPDPLQIG